MGREVELHVNFAITAIPILKAESIDLEIEGDRISGNWRSQKLEGQDDAQVRYSLPDWVKAGNRFVKAIMVGDNAESSTEPFTVMFPKR